MRYEDFINYFNSVYEGIRTPNRTEEFALGLTYGDVGNAYAKWQITDKPKRLRLSKKQKEEVVTYMKERYSYWLKKIGGDKK